MALLDWLLRRRPERTAKPTEPEHPLPGEAAYSSSEQGRRATPEAALDYLYRTLWVSTEFRQTVLDIRQADRLDGRVKKIHLRASRAAAKGGLVLRTAGAPTRLMRAWKAFQQRTGLCRREKLESDLRGLMMEGNLPIQWVLDGAQSQVIAGLRMPSETLLPKISPAGRFIDVREAYQQIDPLHGNVLASFALWQLTLCRLTPDNYDDWGAMGRPYLDASRGVWKKLRMTEEDLVLRRRMRAPLRMAHVLEGASPDELAAYRLQVEQDQAHGNFKDYYLNKRGAVSPVQGDAQLDQIADVAHLLDTFFAGAPAPKGLFGYVGDLSRDILEDLKRDWYEELDALQDAVSFGYDQGFRLDLLLAGINPDAYEFKVEFAERKTDTANQRADLGLKYQALGVSRQTTWEAAGLDAAEETVRLERQAREVSPYPEEGLDRPLEDGEDPPTSEGKPRVAVTPGNGRKGESATSITTRSR